MVVKTLFGVRGVCVCLCVVGLPSHLPLSSQRSKDEIPTLYPTFLIGLCPFLWPINLCQMMLCTMRKIKPGKARWGTLEVGDSCFRWDGQ